MFKNIVRYLLNRSVNRHRFNDTPLYNIYLLLFRPAAAQAKTVEKAFYRNCLNDVDARIIFDVGANEGNKAYIFCEFAESVVCIEPNKHTADVLRQRFKNRPKVQIVEKACGARKETRNMHTFRDSSPYDTLSDKWQTELANRPADAIFRPRTVSDGLRKVDVTTLDNMIAIFGLPGYIKIDVEGFELEVIRGLSTSVPLLSFECNLPVFKSETIEIIKILTGRSQNGVFNFTTTEPPRRFEEKNWLSGAQITRLLNDDRFAFMEIYFRSAPPDGINSRGSGVTLPSPLRARLAPLASWCCRWASGRHGLQGRGRCRRVSSRRCTQCPSRRRRCSEPLTAPWRSCQSGPPPRCWPRPGSRV